MLYSAEKDFKGRGREDRQRTKQKVEAAIKDLRESIKSDEEKDMQRRWML